MSGPAFQGAAAHLRADMMYLTQVDRENALGLGKNAVVSGAMNSDGFVAVTPAGQVVELRVPYPLGFFSRSASGRVDDAKTDWKRRGLWSNYSTYTPWHLEGGIREASS